MLTLERMRHAVATYGPSSLDWTSKDIQQSLANCRAFEDAGQPYDRKRASEYADELAIVATVRRETAGRTACPCCGRA
jgi:hypothetical protein